MLRTEEPARSASLAYFVIGRVADPIELAALYGGPACRDPGLHTLGVAAAKLAVEEIGALVDRVNQADGDSGATDQIVTERAERIAGQLARLRDGVREGSIEGPLEEIERILQGLRAVVSQVVLKGAEEMIAATIGASPPGDGAAGERESLREAAEQRARALGKCVRFAAKIGLDAEVRKTIKAIERAAEKIAVSLLSTLERGSGGVTAAAIEAATTSLGHAVWVVELIAGPDRADELRVQGFSLLGRLRAA
jgi:hypothetical protein